MLAALKEVIRSAERRNVPAGRHYFNALVLVFFCQQVISGILLMIYYRPSAEAAYYSTAIITDEVRLGWLIRSLHRWGSDLLVLLTLLHMIRVYFSRAYQAPRQLNWALGICLLVLVLALGFTGTLLPWDQYAYWYMESARRTIAGVPLLGNALLALFWGGWEVGEEVLLRFYAFHVGVLPWLALSLLIARLLMVWRFGVKEPAGMPGDPRPRRTPLFPDIHVNVFITVLFVNGLLLTLAVFFPSSLSEQADPLSPLPDPPPRWYLLPLRELLRHLPGAAATLAVIAFFLVLFLVPALDAKPAQTTSRRVLQRTLGSLVIAGWVLLGVRAYLR